MHVLESKAQNSSKGLLKWKPLSRIYVCLGQHPSHAINVTLILNTSSGHMALHHHAVFDNEFTLMPALRMNTVP